MDINPITNGMINISTIPVTCDNCGCVFTESQNIQYREIVICPFCGLVMMAIIEKYGAEAWEETLLFVPVAHDGSPANNGINPTLKGAEQVGLLN